jgi:hypothetical protein
MEDAGRHAHLGRAAEERIREMTDEGENPSQRFLPISSDFLPLRH